MSCGDAGSVGSFVMSNEMLVVLSAEAIIICTGQ